MGRPPRHIASGVGRVSSQLLWVFTGVAVRLDAAHTAASAAKLVRTVARGGALPRSGRRILVFQLALERTWACAPLYSTAFKLCSLYSPPSCSRGALKTLHNTVFPR